MPTNFGGPGYKPGGASGTGTGPGASLREISPIVISPTTTVDVDVLGTGRLFAVYHLLIDQPAAPKLTKITVDMVSDGSAPVHSVPSDVGDIQNIETITVLDTGAIRLKIKNNEANNIIVSGKVIE